MNAILSIGETVEVMLNSESYPEYMGRVVAIDQYGIRLSLFDDHWDYELRQYITTFRDEDVIIPWTSILRIAPYAITGR